MIKKILNKKITILLILLAVLVLTVTALVLAEKITLPWERKQTETSQKEGINYNPPTEEEEEETEKFKTDQVSKEQDALNQPKSSSNQATGLKAVEVVLTSWGQNKSTKDIEVSGLVNATPENGGICTLVAQKDGKTITATTQGTPNAQNVSCGTVNIAYSELSPGSWNIRFDYKSPLNSGSSANQVLMVE